MSNLDIDSTPQILLLCPQCGYDLRGTPGDRCSECGLSIDRALLNVSGFPWAHRRATGRFNAYLRTFGLVTFRSSRLVYESVRPQVFKDARAFARVTAALVAAALLIWFCLLAVSQPSLAFLDFPRLQARSGPIPGSGYPALDFELPWSAGATIWPVIPICLILLAIYLASAARSVMARRSFDPIRRRRAASIACYASAPLAMLLPASLLLASAAAYLREGQVPFQTIQTSELLIIAAFVVAATALAMTLVRAGQWTQRTSDCGMLAAIFAGARLLLLFAFGILVIVGLIPWCVGFLLIVVQSVR